MRNWFIIIQGLLPMMLISAYQYSWNLLITPLMRSLNVDLPAIQVAYSLFVLFSTISQVLGGYIADRRGPRLVGVTGGVLAGLGMVASPLVNGVNQFYALWSMGSIGVGLIYGVSINLGVKWFSRTRGLATGIINMGFGLGATFFNPLISLLIIKGEYRYPMMLIGALILAVVIPLMATAKYPPSQVKAMRLTKIPPGFWLVFASFSLMGIPLQLLSSSLSILGEGYGYIIVATAASLLPLFSGIGRPIMGSISDKLSRRKTILVTGVALTVSMLTLLIHSPIAYMASTVITGIFGGSVITLFASLVGDEYGTVNSTFLFGILYNGKFVSALISSVVFAELLRTINLTNSLIIEAFLTAVSILVFMVFTRVKSRRQVAII
ncbi:MFS transporter [Caldivirga maquilingensis]|uniref:Major facilitator superfamily MFS_1 n=1 Tax=Caldivirga maquilingensis (strain ATCC 700844 / DSM 13496 / JCM 10307 / IC-167) TaxID=397948 RepID=A8MC43_CALMQ|nr:MFS transporter [Caldivirga maquilingensis]ABW01349.1 major facilitator superfamily MFS_1 [Caldivirga maquilingensis IC-167]